MSDKINIIRLFRYLKYGYLTSGIIALSVGFFVPLSDALYFIGLAVFYVPMHLIFLKLFPYRNRTPEVMRKNRESYGVSFLVGLMSIVILTFVTAGMLLFSGKSFYSSLYVGVGLSSIFLFFITSKHVKELSKRDEIFIQ